MLFLSINEDGLFSLNSYSMCVCVWASHCLCVGAPTLFLSSCGFKNKLPHSLFQAPKEYWRVPSIYWGVCGVRAKLSIEAWNTHEWLWMHALEWDRVWMLLGVLMWAHQCFNALDRSMEWEVCVCWWVCVPGRLVGRKWDLSSLLGEKSFHAHWLGRVLRLTWDSPPDCWFRTVLPIAKRGWRGAPTLVPLPGNTTLYRLVDKTPSSYLSQSGKVLLRLFTGVWSRGWVKEKEEEGKNSPKKPILAVEYLPPISFQSSFLFKFKLVIISISCFQ